MNDTAPLLEVRDLAKHFPVRGGLWARPREWVQALDGISLDLYPGETLALVGESGCGKTTAARCILRLIPPTAGQVRFQGRALAALSRGELRALRRRMQIVFQDPYGSLNPRMTVGHILAEPIRAHGLARGAELDARVAALLERVGLAPEYRGRYPHEFSGGQRQRIGIARALALDPAMVVCDEAVSALDVSIQAQIINLLKDLQSDLGLAYLFIAHDLNVVDYIAHRVAVMYLGKIVELGPVERIFGAPRHPYTRALLAANPVPDPDAPHRPVPLAGDVPSPLHPPAGCRFHTRCPEAMDRCRTEAPACTEEGEGREAHRVWCHLYGPQQSPAE